MRTNNEFNLCCIIVIIDIYEIILLNACTIYRYATTHTKIIEMVISKIHVQPPKVYH